ncbi:adenosylmethionine--8-amino-7-oxononanoate transaminase [Desulfobacterota bacterium AH_259_B03_O07]|nr:adenosylmethionine--8-amino-7-oxononanoate transaminase [Desulfobacterota bacterium AH_259_B03_O07]
MSDRTKKLGKIDREYVWHPFTQMKEYEEQEPIVVEGGEGVYLYDTEGRKYIDGVSSLWVNIHGHKVPEIDNAIKNQIDKLGHSTLLGVTNPPAAELAKELIGICPPGLKKVFYSGDGASAVEVAIKMAFQYWQHKGKPDKAKFVYLENGYHGDTLGAVSVGGIELFHSTFKPLLFETYRAPSYYCYRCPLGKTYPSCEIACAKEVEKILEKHHEEICAVILEPYVQAAGGMIVAPEGYVKIVREYCHKYDVLMILDEVATGFGRTGKMFACEHDGVTPDIMVLGKGLTGGYLPLSATITTQKVYDAFLGEYEEFKTFFHGHSYAGNPISCAASLGNLEVFRKHNTLENLHVKIDYFEEELKEFEGLKHVGNVRNKGLMAGIELVEDKETKKPFPLERKIGWEVAENAMQHEVLIRPLGNVVVLMPPIGIPMEDLKKLLKVTYKAVKEATES